MYYYTRQQTKIILAKKILCKEKDAKKNIGDKFPNNPKKKNVNINNFWIWNFLIKLPHKTTIKLGKNILLLIYPQKQLEFSFFFFCNFFANCKDFEFFFDSLQRLQKCEDLATVTCTERAEI